MSAIHCSYKKLLVSFPAIFCMLSLTAATAGAAEKIISDFSRETSPYILDNGDQLTISAKASPTASFEIRIRGSVAGIAGTENLDTSYRPLKNLYITSEAPTTLTLKNFSFEKPWDKYAIELIGDSRLLLDGENTIFAPYITRGWSPLAIYLPAGRSLTIDSARRSGSTEGTLNFSGYSSYSTRTAFSIGGNYDEDGLHGPGGKLIINGGKAFIDVVTGSGTAVKINGGKHSIGFFIDREKSSLTINGGALCNDYVWDWNYQEKIDRLPRPQRDGQDLISVAVAFSRNGERVTDDVTLSVAGRPEYTVPVRLGENEIACYFLPVGTHTLSATDGKTVVSQQITLSDADVLSTRKSQILDFAATTQYPTLDQLKYGFDVPVPLPAPDANGVPNTVGYHFYPLRPDYFLLGARVPGTRLVGTFTSAGAMMLESGMLDITHFTSSNEPYAMNRLLQLRDGSQIRVVEPGTVVRARFDPRCTSTSIELLSGTLEASSPQPSGTDIGDGCPANAITPPASRYALQDGTLACSPQKLRLTGSYNSFFGASFPLFLNAGQHAYVVAMVPGKVLGATHDLWFQNAGELGWIPLNGPLLPFYTAAENTTVNLEFIKSIRSYDNPFEFYSMVVSGLEGTQIYLGYGDSAEEMIEHKRYCGVMQIAPQKN